MKTKEFIKKIEKMGYDIEIVYDTIRVKYCGGILARIDKVKPYTLDTKATFEVKHVKELFDLCAEYASTPIEEREKEEKYYLRKKENFYEDYDESRAFLNLDTSIDAFSISTINETSIFKTQFTQSEINKIKVEQHTHLAEFEQIPVEQIEAE